MEQHLNLGVIEEQFADEFWKRGARVIGVSESFSRSDPTSTVVGVVMRGDYRVDGFGVCKPRIGGEDATTELIRMYRRIDRLDIRAWMLGGSIISWFNVIDCQQLLDETSIPIACVSYYASEGVERYLREYFPTSWKPRADVIHRNGERESIHLKTGHSLFLNAVGMSRNSAKMLIDIFTLDGRVPEPIRMARQLAAALRRDL